MRAGRSCGFRLDDQDGDYPGERAPFRFVSIDFTDPARDAPPRGLLRGNKT